MANWMFTKIIQKTRTILILKEIGAMFQWVGLQLNPVSWLVRSRPRFEANVRSVYYIIFSYLPTILGKPYKNSTHQILSFWYLAFFYVHSKVLKWYLTYRPILFDIYRFLLSGRMRYPNWKTLLHGLLSLFISFPSSIYIYL